MKGFFSINIPTPAAPPPGADITQADWEKLSPAMRREIHRDYARKSPA